MSPPRTGGSSWSEPFQWYELQSPLTPVLGFELGVILWYSTAREQLSNGNILEYFGIFWNTSIMEHSKILQDIMGYSRSLLFHFILEYSRIFQNVTKYSNLFKNIQKYSKIFWKILEYSGIIGKLFPSGTLWHLVWNCPLCMCLASLNLLLVYLYGHSAYRYHLPFFILTPSDPHLYTASTFTLKLCSADCLSSPILVPGQFQAKGQKVPLYYHGIALTSTLQLVAAVGVNHFDCVSCNPTAATSCKLAFGVILR